MKKTIKVVQPKVATTTIENDLVRLTEIITKKVFNGKRQRGGILGGEYGYGVDFENDVFMMKPYCWCEKDDCLWCNGDEKKIYKKFKDKKMAELELAPNFWYKPTNFQVAWYKWIGRDTVVNKRISDDEWYKIFNHCVKSIG